MEPIRIPANSAVYKTGALMLVAGAVPVADAIFLIASGAMRSALALPVSFMSVVGCYGVISGMLDLLKWHRARTIPALLLTKEGIADATGIVTGGLVYWGEVRSVSKVWMNDHHSIAIQLVDNAAYLDRLPAWKRFLVSPSIAFYGTPFLIAESELAVTLDQAQVAIESAQRSATATQVTELPPSSASHWWTAVPPEERTIMPLRSER